MKGINWKIVVRTLAWSLPFLVGGWVVFTYSCNLGSSSCHPPHCESSFPYGCIIGFVLVTAGLAAPGVTAARTRQPSLRRTLIADSVFLGVVPAFLAEQSLGPTTLYDQLTLGFVFWLTALFVSYAFMFVGFLLAGGRNL